MGKFHGRRRTKRRRSKRRRRRKRKRTSTVRKIAKSVAQKVLRKQTESYSLVQYLGPHYTRFASEEGSLISTAGAYDFDALTDVNVLLWGPQTVLAAVQGGGQIPGERMGREIYLTGLQCRLMLRLPPDCPHARITMLVCKTNEDSNYFSRVDQAFGNPTLPWVKTKDLPNRQDFRVVAKKSFYLRHVYNTGNNDTASNIVKRPRFFIPIGKRVLYKETPAAPLECAKEDFLKGHFQVFFQSDVVPWDPQSSNPPNKAAYPQVNGTIDWCYRDL